MGERIDVGLGDEEISKETERAG